VRVSLDSDWVEHSLAGYRLNQSAEVILTVILAAVADPSLAYQFERDLDGLHVSVASVQAGDFVVTQHPSFEHPLVDA
jgi:hypothetical protein